MKRSFILSSLLVGSLALGAGSIGCSGSTVAADPTASATAAQTGTKIAPVAPQAKTMHVRFVAAALSTVPLRDEQRTEIEKLASDAEARHAANGALHAQIMTVLAAQIEAGQIDRTALQPKVDAAADAMNSARPADQAALQRLHAILTPDQRAQFVDAIENHAKAMHGEHAAEHADHAEHGMHAHMEKWAAVLQLTDAQKEQIATIMKGQMTARHGELKAAHEKGKAVLESFKGEQLTLPAPEDAHAKANEMADHVVGVVQAVLPVLTPQQRSIAAAKLRERAAAGADDEGPIGE